MKYILFAFLTILACSAFAKTNVDTTDYWHIKINNVTVAKMDETSIYPSIQFDIKTINTSNILSIIYGNDTPCYDCITTLYIVNDHNKKEILAKGKGTFNPLNVPLLIIKQISKRLGRKSLNVYYTDNFKRNRLIFRLDLKHP